MSSRKRTPPHLRVLARSIPADGGCIVYTGTGRKYGYVDGWTAKGKKMPMLAHRVVYEALVGPIPEALHIDHLCRNTRCVNHHHLEAVTQQENNRRTRKSACHKGHPRAIGSKYCPGCAKEKRRAKLDAETPEQREARLQKVRDYYAANREIILAQQAAAYRRNPEPAKARARAWHQKRRAER